MGGGEQTGNPGVASNLDWRPAVGGGEQIRVPGAASKPDLTFGGWAASTSVKSSPPWIREWPDLDI